MTLTPPHHHHGWSLLLRRERKAAALLAVLPQMQEPHRSRSPADRRLVLVRSERLSSIFRGASFQAKATLSTPIVEIVRWAGGT